MAARRNNRQRNVLEYKSKQLEKARQVCRDYSDQDGFAVRFINDYIGEGVFTEKTFNSGDFLLEYHGDLIKNYKKALRLEIEYTEAELGSFMYFFRCNGKKMCIDATNDIFRHGRMVNDSPKGDETNNCKPNVVFVDEIPHICFFASRKIAVGEELRFDYGDGNLPWRKEQTITDGQDTADIENEEPMNTLRDESDGQDTADIENEEPMNTLRDESDGQDTADIENEEPMNTLRDESDGQDTADIENEEPMNTLRDESGGQATVAASRANEQDQVKQSHRVPDTETNNTSLYNGSKYESDGFVNDDALDDSYIDSDYVPDSEDDESDEIDHMTSQHSILKMLDVQVQDQDDTSKYKTADEAVEDSTDVRTPEETVSTQSMSASISIEPAFTASIAEHPDPGSDTYTIRPTNNSTARSYDKKFNCMFCNVLQSKLPRHMATMHADEKEVQLYMQEQDSKVKGDMLKKIRNLGNFQHNAKVIRQQKGSLLVKYRPADEHDTGEYLPCEFCYGYYKSSELWKHVKRCTLAPSSSNKKSRRVVTSSRHLLPEAAEVSSGLRKLLSTFSSDEVSRIVKSDSLILKLGEKMFKRHGHDTEQYSMMRTRLRELGRLLRELRNVSQKPNAKLKIFIDPTLFQTVVKATKIVSGFSETTNSFKTPSLALKIGHSLKKCCRIVEGEALETNDQEKEIKSTGLFKLIEMNWENEVSTHALRTLGERKRNKVKLIPLTNDVKRLTDYLKTKGKESYEALEVSNSNVSAWSDLSKVTLAQIILFNRRRQGEVSKMTLADYTEHHSASEEDVSKALTPFERKLCNVFRRVEIVGKRGRTVPVLLTNEVKTWMDLLVKARGNVGVSSKNEFIFARPHYGSEGHIRGSDCIREYSKDCGAERPNLMRSTKLRFQIATLSQILNLKDHELDLLADFLGHDIRVHREFYRLPEHTLQVAKVSKILLALETGQISNQAGKSLDEITIDADDEIDVDNVSGSEMEEEDDEPMDIETSSTVSTSSDVIYQKKAVATGGKKRQIKRPWSEGEKSTVLKYFQHEILRCKLPGKRDIEECIRKNQVLKHRTWKNIKDCIRNTIDKKKSKQMF